MSDSLDIQINKTDGCTTMVVSGKINFNTYAEFEKAIGRLLQEKVLCIDMRNIKRLSSSGLGVLVAALEEMNKREHRLVLVAPSLSVRKTIDATGFLELFEVVDEIDTSDFRKH